MCTLLQRACQGIIVLSVSLGAAADGVVRNASGGSVCVCVGRGGRGGACAGAYFLMGLRACGFVALCNNPIGFRHRNPTSTYQFITNNYPTIKKSPNIMNMIIGMTASEELHSFC